MIQQEDYFYVKQFDVNIINETDDPVYLNTVMIPGGVLIHQGETNIDGDHFWIIASNQNPLVVTFKNTGFGRKVTRWCDELQRGFALTKTGAACGLSNLRCFNDHNYAKIDVLIKRG